jgi:RNA polymerase sigma-70 factor (ECF subfamily)
MTTPPAGNVVQRLAQGDATALGELYDRYAGIVNGIARRILKDSGEAEDVVQTVFIQAWQQAHCYNGERGTVAAWLCNLARTRALDALRSRLSRREASRDVVAEAGRVPVTEEMVAVQQALGRLPVGQRQTIELAFYEGLTQVEIAERLGQPVGTVKTRARAALKRLRTALEPLGALRGELGAEDTHYLAAAPTHRGRAAAMARAI